MMSVKFMICHKNPNIAYIFIAPIDFLLYLCAIKMQNNGISEIG